LFFSFSHTCFYVFVLFAAGITGPIPGGLVSHISSPASGYTLPSPKKGQAVAARAISPPV